MIGELLFYWLVDYYLRYFWTLRKLDNRKAVEKVNIKLDKLRDKPIKGIEEQKKFLKIKNPYIKYKFDFKFFTGLIFTSAMFVLRFSIFMYIINYFSITIGIWFAITMWIIIPLIVNFILYRYKLNQDSFFDLLRWK